MMSLEFWIGITHSGSLRVSAISIQFNCSIDIFFARVRRLSSPQYQRSASVEKCSFISICNRSSNCLICTSGLRITGPRAGTITSGFASRIFFMLVIRSDARAAYP